MNHDLIVKTTNRVAVYATIALISFPLIAAGLFTGSELSAQHKNNLLIASAEKLVSENQSALSLLADYQFSPKYLEDSERTLNILNKIDILYFSDYQRYGKYGS